MPNFGALSKLGSLSPGYLSTSPDEATVQPVLFAGQQAQGADLDALKKAQSLIDQGAPAQQVYQQTAPQGTAQSVGRATNYIPSSRTGWFQGADGKYRFEFDDSKSKFSPEAFEKLKMVKDVKLGELLSHPELFKLYPEIANIKLLPLSLQEMDEGLRGSYEDKTNTLRLHTDPEIARSTLMHELQHWIQTKEGFAAGGGETAIKPNLELDQLKKINDELKSYIENYYIKYNQMKGLEKEMDPSLFRTMMSNWMKDNPPDFKNFYNEKKQEKLTDLNKRMENLDDYEVYRRLAGETEARNVQNRLSLISKERQKKMPSETQEFPYSEQFVMDQ